MIAQTAGMLPLLEGSGTTSSYLSGVAMLLHLSTLGVYHGTLSVSRSSRGRLQKAYQAAKAYFGENLGKDG